MHEAVAQRRPSDTFNIMTFSGSTAQLFKAPMPANATSIKQGQEFVDQMMAGGGTYMGDAIAAALSTEVAANRNRYVFFMTDGYVGNEEEILGSTKTFVKTL